MLGYDGGALSHPVRSIEELIITSGRFKTFTLVLCTFVAFIAYSNVLGSFFLSDDFAQIGKVLEGDLSVTWGQSHGGFFRPLFIFSYFFDAKLWSRTPFGFHLTNLLLHILNAFLVFLLSQSLIRDARLSEARQQRAIPLASALIFLLHPSHTEAVTWISGRADLLATIFALLSTLSFVSFARSTDRRTHLALSLAFFALALLSKEAAISVPFMMLCVGIYLAKHDAERDASNRSFQTSASRNVKAVALFFLLLVVYIGVRTAALGAMVGGYGTGQHLNFTHGVVVSQLLRFSLRALFPALLLRSLPFLESRALSPILIVTGIVVIIVAAIILRRRERRRTIAARVRRNTFAWLLAALFVSSLLPVINLRINVFDTQGERFLYLASVFSSVALAFITSKLIRNRTAWTATIVCLLAFYAVSLWQTNRIWREASVLSRNILDETVRHATNDSILLLNLPDNLRGAHLYRNGFEQALHSFQDAKPIRRAHVVAFHPLASANERLELNANEAGVFSLRPSNDKTTFERINDAPECMEILEKSERLLRLRLRDCAPTTDVFYYSAGRIHAVEPRAQ
ncbi:MAG TPA: hypothetical protein VF666_18985 [Pyrinomonadaceae bacterium]|jgi:hypothetical protein